MKIDKAFFQNSFKIYKRAINLLWKVAPGLFSTQVVLHILQSLIPVLTLVVTKNLFDSIIEKSGSFDEIFFWLIILAGLQIAQVFLGQVSGYLTEIYQEKLIDSINGLIIKKSIDIPYPYFEDPKYYDSLHLAQRQSIYKMPMLFQQLQTTFSNFLSLGLLLIYFFSLVSLYAWVILLIAIPLAVVKWYSGFALHRLETKTVPLEREADYYHYILTGESYAHEIRTLNFGESLLRRFRNLRSLIYEQKKSLQKKLLGYTLIAEAVEVSVLFYILIGVARQAFLGILAISLLIVYIQGIQRMQSNLKNFLNSLVQLVQQRIFLNDIFLFLDIAEKSSWKKDQYEFPVIDFGISVRNLKFSYPGMSKETLQDISMDFGVGKIVGVVGANGSGKSTLVKLLAGLYSPSSGSIKLGNQSLENIRPESLRENSLFLFQDFQKYFLSIEDIISLGKEDKEGHEKKLQESLNKSQSAEFVSKFKEGWKSKMGRIFLDGKGLSGGQWQKLSIARAFYRNPKIVVLDEPTSSLDAISETMVFDQLKKESADRITILITHRLYNLKDADYIYVLDEGIIRQEGKFGELVLEEGIFRDLYQRQSFI
ncbi:MAG: ABC transporter ATP-binding protein [Algoriphagus sp.]|nr:ABC transporter ATP-binding protein [Algoriphagus sp.]